MKYKNTSSYLKFTWVFLLISLFYCDAGYSWSSTGHRIVAAIAYSHLTPCTKRRVNQITKTLFHSHDDRVRFLLASTWPDQIKYDDISAFNSYHYIDYPYAIDDASSHPYQAENVAWAIQQSLKVIASRKATRIEKAWFLSFLVHFVGDAHQPMHCINFYSQQFPDGDQGGNRFLIKTSVAKNLHQYWDRGAGVLKPNSHHRRRLKWITDQIQREYPLSHFGKRVKTLDPWTWTRVGYQLAKKYAYTINPNSAPPPSYAKMAQQIAKRQLALAGYRLANLLNLAFSHGGSPCSNYQ